MSRFYHNFKFKFLKNRKSFKGMKSTPVRTPATTTHDESTRALATTTHDPRQIDQCNIHTHVIVPDNKSPVEKITLKCKNASGFLVAKSATTLSTVVSITHACRAPAYVCELRETCGDYARPAIPIDVCPRWPLPFT